MRSPSALLLIVLAGGCYNGSVELSIAEPERYAARNLSYTAAVYAPGAQVADSISCVDFEYGRRSLDEIAATLANGGPALPGAKNPVEDIPREGKKLIVIEGAASDVGLVLRGCSEVGEIDGPTDVRVDMHPVVTLALNHDELAPVVPLEGEGSYADPAIELTSVDAYGEPVKADVLWSIVRADGSVAVEPTEAFVPETAAPFLFDVRFTVLGPFTFAVAPRYPSSKSADPIPGFGVPAETAIRPFGDDATAALVAPYRLEDGRVAVVRFVNDGEQARLGARYSLELAVSATTGTALPTFETVDLDLPAPSYTPQNVHTGVDGKVSYLARSYATYDGPGELNGKLWLGGMVRIRPDAAPESVFEKSTRFAGPNGGEVLAALVLLQADRTASVGPCARGPSAGPHLTLASVIGVAGRAAVVLDPDAADASDRLKFVRTFDEKPPPVRSYCAADAEGKLHRVVLMFTSATEVRAVDLGDGITSGDVDIDALNAAFDDTVGEAVPTSFAIGVLGPPEAPHVATASLVRAAVRVLEFPVLASDDDTEVFGEPTERYPLPAVPNSAGMGSGRLFSADRYVDHHFFRIAAAGDGATTDSTGETVTDTGTESTLVIAVDAPTDSTDIRAGTVVLEDCAPAAACYGFSSDSDGDGVDELFAFRIGDNARQVEDADTGNALFVFDNVPVVAHAIRFRRD